MKKQDLYHLAQNPNHIRGIFNYCDRWCERCPLTQRCMAFALEPQPSSRRKESDLENEQFWEDLGELFQVTMEMLADFAQEQNIDLEAINFEAIDAEGQKLDEQAHQSACARMSEEYVLLVKSWFESAQPLFAAKAAELQTLADIGLPESALEKDVNDLTDITEVIHWYQTLIHTKIMRAVMGVLEDMEFADDFPNDADGSAKVALIGIDRSVAAWGKMLAWFPSQEDELLNILVQLEKLRRHVEQEFPNARSFVRPGFDTQA